MKSSVRGGGGAGNGRRVRHRSGALHGAVTRVLNRGVPDASERPREDAPPENEPNKQPSLEGTLGATGCRPAARMHIERKTPAKRAEETNKRDVGQQLQPGGPARLARLTKLIPPKTRRSRASRLLQRQKLQAEPVIDQSTVAQPAPPFLQQWPQRPRQSARYNRAATTPQPPPVRPASASTTPRRSAARPRRSGPAAGRAARSGPPARRDDLSERRRSAKNHNVSKELAVRQG